MDIPRSPMVTCILRGVLYWIAYAVLEFGFSSVIPLLRSSDTVLSPWHWKLTMLVLATYTVMGLLSGFLVSLVTGGDRRNAMCALTLVTAAIANQALSPRLWYANPSLFAMLPIAVVLVLQLRQSLWTDRLVPLRNHWVVGLLLLAPSWVGKELIPEESVPARMAASALVLLMMVVLPLFLRRALINGPMPWQGAIVLAVGAILAICAATVTHLRRHQAITDWKPSKNVPNIVMLVLDTVRQDHLSVYGYERRTTPNLERLAEESTLFHRAIATSDVTLSSHGSLFTGLYPSSHGAHYAANAPPMGQGLRRECTTMAEVLAKSGYTTAAVVANYGYLGPEFGLMRGFQHVNSLEPVRLSDGIRNFYLREGVRRTLRRFMSDWEFFLDSRRSEEINEDAFDILSEAARRKSPLFLFLNYLDAHYPYVPPAPYDRKFSGFDPSFTYSRFDRMQEEVTSLRRKIRPSEKAHLISQYDGAIAYLDSQLGILFDRLKQLGLYENSLIIVTSDHGEAFGERSLLQHAGVSVYQDEVLVPLLIKYPGKAPKTLVTENVSQVDVFPSVLEALGLPVPRNIAGKSLAAGPLDGGRPIISESFPNNYMAQFHPRFRRIERALFVGSLKLIRSTAGKRELYNVTEDPHENRNLYGSQEGRDLEAALQDWLETARPSAEPQAPLPKPSKRVVDRLRTLGYVQ